MNKRSDMRRRGGFTLVELSVVIVIIGILAAFAVPKFRKAVERSKAGEAFNYLDSVRASQERYFSRESTYTDNLGNLDINMPPPKYFDLPTVVTGDAPAGGGDNLELGWSLTLSRTGATSGYGAYAVIFNQDGYVSPGSGASVSSNINSEVSPMSTN